MPSRIPRSLKSNQISPLPPAEAYPFSTFPLLFFVCISLIVLACVQSPKPTSQFVTTYNTHQRQDGTFQIFVPRITQRPQTSWLNSELVSAFKIVPSNVVAFLEYEIKKLSSAVMSGSSRSGGVVRRAGVRALYSENPSLAVPAQQPNSIQSTQHQPPTIPSPSTISPSSSSQSSLMGDEQFIPLLPGKVQNALFGFSFTIGVLLMIMVFTQTL